MNELVQLSMGLIGEDSIKVNIYRHADLWVAQCNNGWWSVTAKTKQQAMKRLRAWISKELSYHNYGE